MNKVESALQRTTDTKDLIIGAGVVSRTAEMFAKLFPQQTAIIIADLNTWEVAGKAVFASLEAAGIPQEKPFIFTDKELYAEWQHVEKIHEHLKNLDAIAIAVGSGVMNDMTKYASHLLGRKYMCVGTAASMDGYTAYGASITKDGNKQTFDCPAPYGFVMDPVIAADAPKELAASGYADLIAKIPAAADWLLADVTGNEPVDKFAWDLVQDGLREALGDPAAVFAGDVAKTEALSEGLLMSGFAMQAARSSRPASCADHLFSHYLDMTHHTFNGNLQSHGFQVAIGTLTMCAFFDAFIEMDLRDLDVEKCVEAWPSLEEEQQRALDIFKDFVSPRLGYDQITIKYNDKEAVRGQLTLFKKHWPLLKAQYRKQVYPFEKMQECFRKVGAPADPADIGVTRQQLKDMMPFVQLMRWRMNMFDLARRGGFYDELVEKVFGKGGRWEIA
mgnify:CR=1 FL=1